MSKPTYYADRRRPGPQRLVLRGSLLLGAVIAVTALGGWTKRVRATEEVRVPAVTDVARHMGTLVEQLDAARGEAAVVRLQLERANAILQSSSKYQIPADLSAAIYDIALSEGIDPALGYRLVKVESNFKAGAKSYANAIGYAQVQLPTARLYEPGIDESQLYDRDVNLRIGFRFLKDLLVRFDHDLHLALLAYNRGPSRVAEILAQGGDPANGYSDAVLQGYRSASTRGASQ